MRFFLFLLVFVYLVCSPRQLFFHCVPETRKCRAPLPGIFLTSDVCSFLILTLSCKTSPRACCIRFRNEFSPTEALQVTSGNWLDLSGLCPVELSSVYFGLTSFLLGLLLSWNLLSKEPLRTLWFFFSFPGNPLCPTSYGLGDRTYDWARSTFPSQLCLSLPVKHWEDGLFLCLSFFSCVMGETLVPNLEDCNRLLIKIFF